MSELWRLAGGWYREVRGCSDSEKEFAFMGSCSDSEWLKYDRILALRTGLLALVRLEKLLLK